MNLELAILLTLLAEKGELEATAIRRKAGEFVAPQTLADVQHAIRTLEEKGHILGTEGPREDDAGRNIPVFTLTTKGKLRAIRQ